MEDDDLELDEAALQAEIERVQNELAASSAQAASRLVERERASDNDLRVKTDDELHSLQPESDAEASVQAEILRLERELAASSGPPPGDVAATSSASSSAGGSGGGDGTSPAAMSAEEELQAQILRVQSELSSLEQPDANSTSSAAPAASASSTGALSSSVAVGDEEKDLDAQLQAVQELLDGGKQSKKAPRVTRLEADITQLEQRLTKRPSSGADASGTDRGPRATTPDSRLANELAMLEKEVEDIASIERFQSAGEVLRAMSEVRAELARETGQHQEAPAVRMGATELAKLDDVEEVQLHIEALQQELKEVKRATASGRSGGSGAAAAAAGGGGSKKRKRASQDESPTLVAELSRPSSAQSDEGDRTRPQLQMLLSGGASEDIDAEALLQDGVTERELKREMAQVRQELEKVAPDVAREVRDEERKKRRAEEEAEASALARSFGIPSAASEKGKEDTTRYCVCRLLHDPRRPMIGCDLCADWFHLTCVNLSPTEARCIDCYICPRCKPNTQQKTTFKPKREIEAVLKREVAALRNEGNVLRQINELQTKLSKAAPPQSPRASPVARPVAPPMPPLSTRSRARAAAAAAAIPTPLSPSSSATASPLSSLAAYPQQQQWQQQQQQPHPQQQLQPQPSRAPGSFPSLAVQVPPPLGSPILPYSSDSSLLSSLPPEALLHASSATYSAASLTASAHSPDGVHRPDGPASLRPPTLDQSLKFNDLFPPLESDTAPQTMTAADSLQLSAAAPSSSAVSIASAVSSETESAQPPMIQESAPLAGDVGSGLQLNPF